MFIALTGHTCDHSWRHVLLISCNVLQYYIMSTFNSFKVKYNNDIHLTTYIIMFETDHVEHPFFCFIIYVVEVRMFVSHVSIKVELLELGEPAETKKAEDFLSEVVAEVAIAPNLIIRNNQ